MTKKYKRTNLWAETYANFKNRKIRIDADLKALGIRRQMPLTRVLHLASMQPITLGTEEITRISRRRKFKFR